MILLLPLKKMLVKDLNNGWKRFMDVYRKTTLFIYNRFACGNTPASH